MSGRLKPTLHVLQAKLANPQLSVRYGRIFFRKRGIVPGVYIILTKANSTDAWRERSSIGRRGRIRRAGGYVCGDIQVVKGVCERMASPKGVNEPRGR